MTNFNLATMTDSQGISITGINDSDTTGVSVASAGDVNNDGYDDVIIGAPNYPSGNGVGRAYVVYGGASLTNINIENLTITQGFSITGINNNDFTGNFVNSAGDINLDGFDDIIVGSPGYPSGTYVGRAYVIYGGINLENINLVSLTAAEGFSITGINNIDYTANSVSGAGDINNDGYSDMIIGVQDYPSGTSIGRAYVIYGGTYLANINLASLTPSQGFTITGINDADATGYGLSDAGDINNDGYADIIVGAYSYPSGSQVGRAYVIYGGNNLANINLASLTSSQGFAITGINDGDLTGASLASAGDINKDGYGDMIIGSQGYPSGTNVGRAYVIYGNSSLTNINLANLTVTQGFSITGSYSNDLTGNFVNSAGDINLDGFDDIIVGSPGYPSGNNVGRAYVVYGGANLTNINLKNLSFSQGFAINGIYNGDQTGVSVASAGDINKDGYVDLIIGAHGYPSGANVGRAYIVYGPYADTLKFYGMFSRVISFTPMNATAPDGTLKTGVTDGWCSYASNFVVGDFNGDGKADLLCNSNMPYGKNYIMLSQGENDDSISFVPPLTADENGFLTMGINNIWCDTRYQRLVAGDFNGDGKTDLFCNNNQEQSPGRNFVMLSNGNGFEPMESNPLGKIVVGSEKVKVFCPYNGVLLASDFDGNGADDIICIDNVAGITVMLSNNTHFNSPNSHIFGRVTFGTTTILRTWCTNAGTMIKAIDFNGDGKADLVCNDQGAINIMISVLPAGQQLNDGVSAFIPITYNKNTDPNGYIKVGPKSTWCDSGQFVVGYFDGSNQGDLGCNNQGQNMFQLFNQTTANGYQFVSINEDDIGGSGLIEMGQNSQWCNFGDIITGDFTGNGIWDVICIGG